MKDVIILRLKIKVIILFGKIVVINYQSFRRNSHLRNNLNWKTKFARSVIFEIYEGKTYKSGKKTQNRENSLRFWIAEISRRFSTTSFIWIEYRNVVSPVDAWAYLMIPFHFHFTAINPANRIGWSDAYFAIRKQVS